MLRDGMATGDSPRSRARFTLCVRSKSAGRLTLAPGPEVSPRSRAPGEKSRSSSFGSSWMARNSSRVREPSSTRLCIVMRVGRARPPIAFTREKTSDFRFLPESV